MNVVMIGAGYVGLVSGSCFAEFGANVTCIDKDESRINALQAGKIPIYEPGLDDLVKRGTDSGSLNFSTALAGTKYPTTLERLRTATGWEPAFSITFFGSLSSVTEIVFLVSKNSICNISRCAKQQPSNTSLNVYLKVFIGRSTHNSVSRLHGNCGNWGLSPTSEGTEP